MNVPVVSHLKLLVNLYNKMNNRFLVLLVIYLIIYLLSVLYKNKQIFCAILLSLLSWERGLKFCLSRSITSTRSPVAPLVGAWIEILSAAFIQLKTVVAPLVGAWIEMSHSLRSSCFALLSLLSWERGLKSSFPLSSHSPVLVAPLVGAWIEMLNITPHFWGVKVAPLVGAWIEIALVHGL